jgi:hypothetical protein
MLSLILKIGTYSWDRTMFVRVTTELPNRGALVCILAAVTGNDPVFETFQASRYPSNFNSGVDEKKTFYFHWQQPSKESSLLLELSESHGPIACSSLFV